MKDEFDFSDLDVIQIPVTGPKPKCQEYLLIEASADAVARYKSMQAKCAKFSGGEMKTVEGIGDLEPYLVSMCLFKIKSDGTSEGVSENFNVVKSWPARVVKRLYDKCREISEIDRDDDLQSLLKQREQLDKLIAKLEVEDPAKNGLSSTQTPSD